MSEVLGYRNPETGVEFYHAETQTTIDRKSPIKFHRDAQTADLRTRKSQSTREQGTQMNRSDLIVFPGPFEAEISPKPYHTSLDVAVRRAEAVLLIQRRWRGFLGRAKAQRIRDQKARDKRAAEDRKRHEEELQQTYRRHEIHRRLHPKTSEDFRLVMEDIKTWSEAHKHESTGFRDTLRLVQQLEKLRIAANKQSKKQLIADFLDQMTRPKLWVQKSTATVTEVETPEITKNKELVQLYNLLEMAGSTKTDERLEILLKLKWEIKIFDSTLTRELNDLIDREADMLNRKRPSASLAGARKRMSWLFLQFISDPQFNPGAVSNRLRQSPLGEKTLAGTINIIAQPSLPSWLIRTPNFRNLKLNALSKTDKSSKSSIDPRIAQLCNTINAIDSFCTLSSCSGRVFLYTACPKKSTHLFVRHFESHDLIRAETLRVGERIGETVWLKFESAILHVACADVVAAQKLLRASILTFPVSGILTLTGVEEGPSSDEARKIVVSLRQDGGLDMPVRLAGRDLYDDETASILEEEIMQRFQRTWANINTLEDVMTKYS